MAKVKKDTWEKTLEEYTFSEISNWMVGCIIFGLVRGETIQDIVYRCLTSLANVGKLKV